MRIRHGSAFRLSFFIVAALSASAMVCDVPATFAQPVIAKERYLFGGFIGYQGNFYSGNINAYNGGSTCGVFTGGSGWQPTFGALMEIPISRKVNLAPRLFWDDRSGTFTVDHTNYSAEVNGTPAVVDMQYALAATLRQISIDVPLKWMPFNKNNFYFLSGFSFGTLIADHYHETQSIISPSNAYFKFNGQQSQVLDDGNYSTLKKIQYGIVFGLGYDLPISKKTFIAPEVTSMFSLSGVRTDVSWSIITLRFTASIKTDISSLFRDEKTIEEIPSQAQPVAAPNAANPNFTAPDASVTVMGLTPDGDQTPHPTLKVEEYLSTDLQPVLNYIFFDDNSATIPQRYVRFTPEQVAAYSDTGLIGANTMSLYLNTLNLVGRRMLENPKAVLRIVGCNSNDGLEKGNTALSMNRAAAVKEYLTSVWKIPAARLKTIAQNLPHDPSSVGVQFGNEENRRVELVGDDPAVLSPMTLAGLERTASPPKIRMYMHSDNAERITSWHAEAVEKGKTVAHIEGTGSIPKTFDWILSAIADTLIYGDEPVHFKLTVADSAGQQTTTETMIQLQALTLRKKKELRIADKKIDKFSLFLFDFDQSTLNARSELILGMVEQVVQPTSSVSVIGFCDRTGEAEHNKGLSLARAQAVADHIKNQSHPAVITSEGRGDTELLFDNAVPEGRYFSRTVYVRVETPVVEPK